MLKPEKINASLSFAGSPWELRAGGLGLLSLNIGWTDVLGGNIPKISGIINDLSLVFGPRTPSQTGDPDWTTVAKIKSKELDRLEYIWLEKQARLKDNT